LVEDWRLGFHHRDTEGTELWQEEEVESIVEDPGFEELQVVDAQGQAQILTAKEAHGALLAQLRGRPEVVLVLPSRGKAEWITGVTEIVSER
jgi:hypothetical protein